jgi:hypothetical protein
MRQSSSIHRPDVDTLFRLIRAIDLLSADRSHQRELGCAAALCRRVGAAIENSFKADDLATAAQAALERA